MIEDARKELAKLRRRLIAEKERIGPLDAGRP